MCGISFRVAIIMNNSLIYKLNSIISNLKAAFPCNRLCKAMKSSKMQAVKTRLRSRTCSFFSSVRAESCLGVTNDFISNLMSHVPVVNIFFFFFVLWQCHLVALLLSNYMLWMLLSELSLISVAERMCLAVKSRLLSGSVIDIQREWSPDWKRDDCKEIWVLYLGGSLTSA